MNDLEAVMRMEVAHQRHLEERQICSAAYRYLLACGYYGPIDWITFQPKDQGDL